MPREKKKRTVIIAGNYAQALHYCWLMQLNPRGSSVVIASNAYMLRGLSGPLEVVKVGTWRDRRDMVEVEQVLAVIEATSE